MADAFVSEDNKLLQRASAGRVIVATVCSPQRTIFGHGLWPVIGQPLSTPKKFGRNPAMPLGASRG